MGAIRRQRSICGASKFESPIQRTFPSRCSFAISDQPSSISESGCGQWIWYRSIVSTFSRRRLASHSRRTDSALSEPDIWPWSSHTRSHLVNT